MECRGGGQHYAANNCFNYRKKNKGIAFFGCPKDQGRKLKVNVPNKNTPNDK